MKLLQDTVRVLFITTVLLILVLLPQLFAQLIFELHLEWLIMLLLLIGMPLLAYFSLNLLIDSIKRERG